MTQTSPPAPVSAEAEEHGELAHWQAHYAGYCRAMRMLVEEGKSLKKIRRTVCWKRLEVLHRALPRRYREPEGLYRELQSMTYDHCQCSAHRYVGES